MAKDMTRKERQWLELEKEKANTPVLPSSLRRPSIPTSHGQLAVMRGTAFPN